MPVYNAFLGDPRRPGTPAPGRLRQFGPVTAVEVHVPPGIAAALVAHGLPIPAPVTGLAVIDTGAGVSAVDQSVFPQLGLHPVGTTSLSSAAGTSEREQYPARLVFPSMDSLSLDLPEATSVDLRGQVVPLGPAGDDRQVIVLAGRDLLAAGVFVWNGIQGTWTFAF